MTDANDKTYVKQESDGSWTLRQERFRNRKHPHDICAVARSYEELKAMCEKRWPAAFAATSANQ